MILADVRRHNNTALPAFSSPDHSKLWAPGEWTPLSYLPSFSRLTGEQQRRYNQLFALGILEQFIWFEEYLICPILEKVLSLENTDPELGVALTQFIREEQNHSAMFWQLLEIAEPEMYSSRAFRLLHVGRRQNFIFELFKRIPKRLVGWTWLTVFFEERTLAMSRHYIRSRTGLDENFVQAHVRHLQDEVGHVQMDSHFIEKFFAPASSRQRAVASLTMSLMLRAFASPKRVSRAILRKMRGEFADFSPELERTLLSELKSIGKNRNYLKVAFGSEATSRTRFLLGRHSAMAPALRRLQALAD